MSLTLHSLLRAAGHLQVYQAQLVGKKPTTIVFQANIYSQTTHILCQHKIGKGHNVDRLDVIVSTRSFLALTDDGF